MSADLEALGLRRPSVLLPAKDVSSEKFAVIACDQFSSDLDYWNEVEREAAGCPSALNLIIPEARLGEKSEADAASGICAAMREYLDNCYLEDIGETFVYVKRQTSAGVRRGLVAAFDLEAYEFTSGAKSLIRATEGTVADRLPARKLVRSMAPLELPHALVLIDEPQNELFELLEARSRDMQRLYDFELMLGGGHIEGYRADSDELMNEIADILERDRARRNGFLFAMGDGNHSFAAAKQWWDELKISLTAEQRKTHPARFALAELVNIHDSALVVEPIHRLLIEVDPERAVKELGIDPLSPPPLPELQPRLDDYLASHEGAALDYIHGADDCLRLAALSSDRLAIIYGDFERASIFRDVENSGALPRKSFSLGVARDKRYYLEGRRITP